MSQDDKLNGNAASMYEIADFHHCCNDLGLFDLSYTRCHFTWSNGTVWSKIDRVLVNPTWASLWQKTQVHFDNQGAFSDHSPAMVRLDQQAKGHCSFKFFNMWTSHVDFLTTVSKSWHLDVVGSPMFSLCRKLKALKNPLKHLNKRHFSHISERVSTVELGLDSLQTALHRDPNNPQLILEDKKLQLQLKNLKIAENMFFSQKLKCVFLQDSDRSSRLFHAMMNQKHG